RRGLACGFSFIFFFHFHPLPFFIFVTIINNATLLTGIHFSHFSSLRIFYYLNINNKALAVSSNVWTELGDRFALFYRYKLKLWCRQLSPAKGSMGQKYTLIVHIYDLPR